MKNLIERIMVIDRSAKAKLDEAARKKEETIRVIDSRKQQMTEDLNAKAKKRLADAEVSEAAIAEESIAAIGVKVETERKRLAQVCTENRDRWIEELVSDIIPAN